ncbi:hypothetical protein PoMZ_06479 [Pyricularia oryzae]|uniref:Uncharacterized protein n=1 Tax=Pyricularia oryzae TaxID=318829 RepID=A0A4V1C7W2_PYROR|nr:hypothetical protein PoMZ_06479 [Pyricularia oryzae]
MHVVENQEEACAVLAGAVAIDVVVDAFKFPLAPGASPSMMPINSSNTLTPEARPSSLLTNALSLASSHESMYFPWVSRPAAAAATSVLEPTSVLRPRIMRPRRRRALSGKGQWRNSSDWHRPGFSALTTTGLSGPSLAASSLASSTSSSLVTL